MGVCKESSSGPEGESRRFRDLEDVVGVGRHEMIDEKHLREGKGGGNDGMKVKTNGRLCVCAWYLSTLLLR